VTSQTPPSPYELLAAAQAIRTLEAQLADARGTAPPTICSHGARVYSLGPEGPKRTVTVDQDEVLQAFLRQQSMDLPTLIKETGNARPDRIIKRLARQFPGAVIRPEAKDCGGYRVHIKYLR
jgi:hypothetical protein